MTISKQRLTLVRGLPGSGKTTLAQKLAAQIPDAIMMEADKYFMVNGEYKFQASQLAKAHTWCLNRTREALMAGTTVFVSNTFTKAWEMEKYVALAIELKVPMSIIEADTPWRNDVDECAKRNTHGVPLDTIERMACRWESAPFTNIGDILMWLNIDNARPDDVWIAGKYADGSIHIIRVTDDGLGDPDLYDDYAGGTRGKPEFYMDVAEYAYQMSSVT